VSDIKIAKLSWEELNGLLLSCNDEGQLYQWFQELMSDRNQPVYRVLRVYGRLSAVRQAKEKAAILRRHKSVKEST
jgi:hypothetical protein